MTVTKHLNFPGLLGNVDPLFALKRKFRYKRTSPSHRRHNLISILIKSCSTQGRLDLLLKELQNKPQKQISRCKAVRTFMYFKIDENLAHCSLNFLLELAMQLRKDI